MTASTMTPEEALIERARARDAEAWTQIFDHHYNSVYRYAYARLRSRDALTAGFDETEILTAEGPVRPVGALPGAVVHATLVPEIFPQPPDLSDPTLWDAAAPYLLSTSPAPAAGRTVYFAGAPDRLNVTARHPDYQRLLQNALRWALNLDARPPLLETDAPPDLHLTLLHQPHSGNHYLHLVNYSGAHGRPVTAPHPTGPVAVRLTLPQGVSTPRAAHLLVAGAALDLHPDAGASSRSLRLTVPGVDRYEIVRLTP